MSEPETLDRAAPRPKARVRSMRLLVAEEATILEGTEALWAKKNERRMTFEAIGRRAEVNPSVASRQFSGALTLRTLGRLARAMGCSVEIRLVDDV